MKTFLILTGTSLLALLLRLFGFGLSENSRDAFFHIRIAAQGWSACTSPHFSSAYLSLWDQNFADKELLFHVLLSGLNKVRLFLGLPEFPFLLPSFVLWFLLTGAFLAAVRCFRLRKWEFLAFFLPVLDAVFCNRMLMVRPLVLSAALILFLFAGSFRLRNNGRKLFLLNLTGSAVFALTYSNPHFYCGIAFLGSCLLFLLTGYRKSAWLWFSGAAAGLFLGMAVHPGMPGIMEIWYWEGVVIPSWSFYPVPPVTLSMEMQQSGCKVFRYLVPFWLLTAGILMLAFLYFRKDLSLAGIRKKLFRHPETALLLPLFLILSAGVLLQHRVIEYALPFGILTAGVLLKQMVTPRFPIRRTAAVLFLICLLHTGYALRIIYQGSLYPPESMARFVRANLPPGTRIANLDWSDGCPLYYSMPEYTFSFILEPVFCFAAHPETMQKIDRFLEYPEQCRLCQEEVFRYLRAEYLMLPCSKHGLKLLKLLLEGPRISDIVYMGPDGILLKKRP